MTAPTQPDSPDRPSAGEGSPERLEILGTVADPMAISDLHRVIERGIRHRERTIITSLNLHGAAMAQKEPILRELHREHLVRIDGMPVILWARLLGHRVTRHQRVTWVDWLPSLLEVARRQNWSIAYLGSRASVVSKGLEWARQYTPGVIVTGRHGHFSTRPGCDENEAVIQWINETDCDILLVGMGMPRQERWVWENANRLTPPIILTCGAAIEYFAGEMPTPPRWMGRLGLEWLARVAAEPARLSRRYFIEPWNLVPLMWDDLKRALR